MRKFESERQACSTVSEAQRENGQDLGRVSSGNQPHFNQKPKMYLEEKTK